MLYAIHMPREEGRQREECDETKLRGKREEDGSGQREGEWEGDSVDLVTGFSLVLVN